MSADTFLQHSSSEDTGTSSLAVDRSVPRRESDSSHSSDTSGNERRALGEPINPTFHDIIRELQLHRRELLVQRRLRRHDFRDFHKDGRHTREELQSFKEDVKKDLRSLKEDVRSLKKDVRSLKKDAKHTRSEIQSLKEQVKDDVRSLREDNRAHGFRLGAMEARWANRGATRIHNHILPVGRYNATTNILSNPHQAPSRVHEFLRLKLPRNWKVLASLLRFYDTESWSAWGLISYDETLEEMLAPPHKTLDEAVAFAPEIALQELAMHLGLDYDAIMTNHEEDEKLQRNRKTLAKRVLPEDSTSLAKREKRDEASPQEHLSYTDFPRSPPPKSISTERIGWDSRRTEDRTPSAAKVRVRDRVAPRPEPSPTSVATSQDAK